MKAYLGHMKTPLGRTKTHLCRMKTYLGQVLQQCSCMNFRTEQLLKSFCKLCGLHQYKVVHTADLKLRQSDYQANGGFSDVFGFVGNLAASLSS